MTGPRIVFAGTPEFAVPALEAAMACAKVVGVLTQPDRPAGRGRKLQASPVKRRAEQAGIEVWQPQSLRPEAASQMLREIEPDLLVTAAYGLLLPQRVLDIPRLGCWNLHASLLPRWRGASPIQQAILAGDAETGISLMQMDAGMDTGPVRMTARTAIEPGESAGQLHDRLAVLAADLLREALSLLAEGRLPDPVAQDDCHDSRHDNCHDKRLATHAPRIDKADALIDWTLQAEVIARMVRAYNPWPVAHATINGQSLRLFECRAESGDPGGSAPGELVRDAATDGRIRVACGEGILAIEQLQPPGKRRMSAADFLNARPDWRDG